MHVKIRPSEAGGFTLVELLVILLIIGILTLIALPAFLGQRMKGQDTEAQTMVRAVATALATHHVDEDTFEATPEELLKLEPVISQATDDLDVETGEDTFRVTERSSSDTEFTLEREADGGMTRTCTMPGRGRCRSDGSW
jgi:Tfp pilus assembly protein PilE